MKKPETYLIAKDAKNNVAGERGCMCQGWGHLGAMDVIKDLECGWVGTEQHSIGGALVVTLQVGEPLPHHCPKQEFKVIFGYRMN